MHNFTSLNISLANQTTLQKLPEFFPVQYRIVATIFQVLVFCTGVFGNISLAIVVRKTRSFHTPTYCYLTSLSIADLIVLFSAVPEQLMSNYLYKGEWILGQAGCSILQFGNFLGINASSLSILCFTIERYIGICHPLLAQKVCSVERAKKIIIGIWIFAIMYCAQWLGLAQNKPKEFPEHNLVLYQCTFRLGREQYVYMFMADLLFFYVSPLVVSVILYTRIGFILRKSAKMHKNLGKNAGKPKHKSPEHNGCTGNGSTRPLLTTPRNTANAESKSSQQEKARIQIVRMLVVVVTLFAILWLPYRGLLVFNSFAPPSKRFLNEWYLLFAKTLVYMNSAINPILYNAMSKKFRKIFLYQLFGIGMSEVPQTGLSETTYTKTTTITPLQQRRGRDFDGGSPAHRSNTLDRLQVQRPFPSYHRSSSQSSLPPPTYRTICHKTGSDSQIGVYAILDLPMLSATAV